MRYCVQKFMQYKKTDYQLYQSSLVNTLPIAKEKMHAEFTEAQEKYMRCFCAGKFAPEGQFRLQLASIPGGGLDLLTNTQKDLGFCLFLRVTGYRGKGTYISKSIHRILLT